MTAIAFLKSIDTQPGRKSLIILSSASVLAAALVGIAAAAGPKAVQFFGDYAYYATAALVAFWVATVAGFLRARKPQMVALLRRHAVVVGCAAAVAAGIGLSVDWRFRVLSDETNQIAVSQAMTYHRTVFNYTMAKWSGNGLQPLSAGLDQRPLVFPFLVHLVHLARGYHVENAFILNLAVLFATLSALGLAVARRCDASTAMAAIFLVVTPPIVAIGSASAGFDFFAGAFTLTTCVVLFYFWEEPGGERFAVLWTHLLILMNIRYESAVIATVILAGLMVTRRFKVSFVTERPWFFGASILLLVPLAVQRIITSVTANTPANTSSFGLNYVWKWTRELLASQAGFDPTLPYAWILNWLAVPIAAYAIYRVARGAARGGLWFAPLRISVAAVGVHLLLILSFYSSAYAHAASERYFVGISILAALSPLLLRIVHPAIFTGPRLLGAGIVAFVVYHPVAVRDASASTLVAVRQFDYQREVLRTVGRKDILVITARPGQVTALRYGAIDFAYANRYKRELLQEIARHRYSDVLVFQRVPGDTGNPVFEDALDPEFRLRPLGELQVSNNEAMRVSRIHNPVGNGDPLLDQTFSEFNRRE